MVSKLKCNSPHMRVYEKEHLPVRMHFADNARIEPIILDLDDAWTVVRCKLFEYYFVISIFLLKTSCDSILKNFSMKHF